MARDQRVTWHVLQRFVSSLQVSVIQNDQPRLKRQLSLLDAWTRRQAMAQQTDRSAQFPEMAELRQKLRTSKSAFDAMVSSYRSLLDSFETFRCTIDLVQRIKRLQDLSPTLQSIQDLHDMHLLHLILDQELFAGRVPAQIGQVRPRCLQEQLKQFSPAVHFPRLYLGDVRRVDGPRFFLGCDTDPQSGSCFIFALRHKYLPGKIIGVVAGYDRDPERYAVEKATDFLSHFCDILASTLIITLEHEQLEELTVRDSLTGINNRTYLERHAPRILDFAVRKNLPVHLLFIDLNGFKAINDTLGHEAGDAILIAVGQTIQAMVRKYDICVRLGGDEFVIMLPDTDETKAWSFVTRLGQALANINVGEICGLATNLRISASVGLARHEPGQPLEDLIRAADLRMFQEKMLARASLNHRGNHD
ncbi:MAG: GGDEF domain-containing protein [Desulfovibrionales bacterium]|nr:GGDEF domain-containing protein [Desulfovibrionales bacterium]